jgi:hypothetical protein
MSSPPPQQPAGWGPLPPPPKPKTDHLPWYQRFWWAIALVALLVGAMMAAAADPAPEPETRTVTQVSERPMFTAECEKVENEFERRQCERIVAGYEKSLQAPPTTEAPTTTRPKPKPTTPPSATIEDGTWAVPNEVKPGTYVSDGGEGCYWARLRSLSGSVDAIIANSISPGRQRVSIAPTDKAFETRNCASWRKVG